MKLLHFSPTFYSTDSVIGGGEKYVFYIVKALQKYCSIAGYGIENLILSLGVNPGLYDAYDSVKLDIIKGAAWDYKSIYLPDLIQRINHADCVIIHQCLTPLGLFVASHARLCNKIVIGMDHGAGEHPLVSHTSEVGYIFDLLLAQSDFAAVSFIGLDAHTEVICGPIDSDYYKPMHIPREKDLVVSVGRILPHKGFERTIKAMPSSLRLVIIGTNSNTDYYNYLVSVIKDYAKQVRIVENASDDKVLDYFCRASLFVHASTHVGYDGAYYSKPELLGLAPLEALSCGTRSYVSSSGSLAELGKIVGCQVFSTDAELEDLLSDYSRTEIVDISANEIRASVNEQYGLFQFGEKLVAQLKRLLKKM